MTNGSVSSIAGTTFGILGMGIGLGILAGTARGVMDTMYGRRNSYGSRGYYSPRKYTRRPRTYYSPKMKTTSFRVQRSYRPRTRSYRRRRSYY